MIDQASEIWGKLTSLGRKFNTFGLRQNEIIIGRNEQCKISIKQQHRISGRHCVIIKKQDKIFLTDLSTNGTYKGNGQKLKKNVQIQLKNNDQIWLLPTSKVKLQESIGFRINFMFQPKKIEQQIKRQQNKLITTLQQQITCPYCYDIMVYPVSVQPCNHRLCGTCLTQLVLKKIKLCIYCKKQLISAIRDSSFNTIIQQFCRANPDKKRLDEDQKPNIFGYEPVNIQEIINGDKIQYQQIQNIMPMEIEKNQIQKKKKNTRKPPGFKKPPKKRQKNYISSDISASTDSNISIDQIKTNQQIKKISCKQCTQQRDGFKCSQYQQHVKCHNCSKIFAKRQAQKVNQSCEICKSYFCNLYIPPCQKNGPKLSILGKNVQNCKLQPIFFRNNKVQMDAFKNLLYTQKKTIGDMFNSILKLAQVNRFQFMIDKRVTRGEVIQKKQIAVRRKSPICDNCWRQLWFQMILFYVKENIEDMPETIRMRPVCHWGINCRTMQHNIEHAKKYNHMQYQTKF